MISSSLQSINSSTQQPFNPATLQPLYLILVGNGPQESQLKIEAGENPNIFFLPFQNQSQMPVVYRMGDVFVLPSQGPGETWGLAVNEAMACQRPVLVGSKAGCSPDLVFGRENGYVFSSGSLLSLQTALESMMREDLRRMGEKSAALISGWSYDSIRDRFIEMVNEIA